jgi:hypothetical protein
MLVLPEETELPDAAEVESGGADPLGLRPVADHLSELLLPGITNRMRRVRFLTAMTVGAVVADEVGDAVRPEGRLPSPALAFEWILMEALVRKGDQDVTGVPGISKARDAVTVRGQRLAAANYLKGAASNGFTGILLPLAVSAGLLDRDRVRGERWRELVDEWEHDTGNTGFCDGVGPGEKFRVELHRAVVESRRAGRCSVSPGNASFYKRMVRAFHPGMFGQRERRWYGELLRRNDETTGFRKSIAAALGRLKVERTEVELAARIRGEKSAPDQLVHVLDTIDAFEQAAVRLDRTMNNWLVPESGGGGRFVDRNVVTGRTESGEPNRIRKALHSAVESAGGLPDGIPDLVALADEFESCRSQGDLADAVLDRHVRVQRLRKRQPWLWEGSGSGRYQVLPQFGPGPDIEPGHYGRSYRLWAFHGLLREVQQ